MRPVLFVRADDDETFGIAPGVFAGEQVPTRVWDAIGGEPMPALDDVAAVVVFGSAFNVEHADEQRFIHDMRAITLETLDRELPYLGICFGSQVLAWALGCEIPRAPLREVGYVPVRPTAAAAEDRLLAHYADGDMVFEWHMDTFELPQEAVLLATGDAVASQAYRVGDLAWATQFHFEIDRPEMDVWIDGTDDLAATWGKTAAEIRGEADRFQERHADLGAETFRRFIDVVREHGA
jgi:GMP synthase (glutamine-hydrolysing)